MPYKVSTLILTLLASLFNSNLIANAQSSPPDVRNMKLIFEDNFNESVLNSSKWVPCYWWNTNGCSNTGNKELQWFTPDEILPQGNYLRLRARKRDFKASDGITYNYTSGIITTDRFGSSGSPRFAFKYGYVEARLKVPKGQGLWPAFWLLPVDHSWPPEIDILEVLGHEPNKVYTTFHWRDSGGVHRSAGQPWVGPDFSADWHTFAVRWQPDSIIWYVDGVERFRYSNRTYIPAKDMYLILNLSVGGIWPGPPDKNTQFPAYLDIDYVRVWQEPQEVSLVLNLEPGWNLISLPVEPSERAIGKIFDPLAGKYDVVYAFNGSQYEGYIPGLNSSKLKALEAGHGYWVYMNEAAKLEVKGKVINRALQLKTGWNLVGYVATRSSPIAQTLSSINGKYSAVYTFDTASDTYQGYYPDGTSSNLKIMEPGKGYWIHALHDSVLIFEDEK
jgi:beta-glucanase (GH16 family)